MLPNNVPWESWASLVFGLIFLFFGIGIRLGRLRAWTKLYRARGLPSYWRNGALALIPGGVFFIAAGALGLMRAADLSSRAWLPLIALCVVLTLGSMALAVWVLWRPPAWLKPRWLRDDDYRATAPGRSGSRVLDS
jgi:hypothetical protein